MKRNIYLSSLKLEDAKKLYFDNIALDHLVKHETILVEESLDRYTAKSVFARVSSPHYNASAMDGIMVKAVDTYGIDEMHPRQFKEGDFKYVDTGDVIEDPYDAVVMIEDVQVIDDKTIELIKAASPWQHVRPIGEDIVKAEMILPKGHLIRPVDIGALLSGGIVEIEVIRKPSVGILPTGTEIVEPKEDLIPGEIIDSNSRMFEAMVHKMGGQPVRYTSIKDDYDALKNHILKMVSLHDIVLINAGSSAGTEDYTVSIIKELGQVLVHGVAIKPGKPAILGTIQDKPVIGIPGYPVSAFFVFDVYVNAMMDLWYGQIHRERSKVKAILSKRLMSSVKHQEYVRMKLGLVENKMIATPLSRGAGVTMSLVKADGICVVPQSVEGYEAGTEVEIELLRDMSDIMQTIVSIGSHDIIMDILGDMLDQATLSSTHVGSMGGIMAMMKGEAHLAPVHLLDADTGVYNVSFLNKYLKEHDVLLIEGIKRIQGLYVPKGNPKNIKGISDLSRDDLVFVNRQKGAGTRLLLDYNLKVEKIDKTSITGYEREMTTHMTVASAVKSGSADLGMGIESVAHVMDLDFIPIGEESYDFVVKKSFYETRLFKRFEEVIQSEEFAEKLNELGGYRIENIGKTIEL
ncbi:molybdopterin biosynthesis protein [Acidaminobacter sp. JC074]|uniref:molybdopterin biosynthesis protein n=1 Tax=Acidaminobacter sp. JC074 TaxID=2530199 RepID=UPI001F1157F5|nr:molybdopterin biosynthesis protein [Acidaminobacter sp. JC074]MCH4888991.1 molybdopterin biosynthesis protein [Acidaminobacter sp. JC074]